MSKKAKTRQTSRQKLFFYAKVKLVWPNLFGYPRNFRLLKFCSFHIRHFREDWWTTKECEDRTTESSWLLGRDSGNVCGQHVQTSISCCFPARTLHVSFVFSSGLTLLPSITRGTRSDSFRPPNFSPEMKSNFTRWQISLSGIFIGYSDLRRLKVASLHYSRAK